MKAAPADIVVGSKWLSRRKRIVEVTGVNLKYVNFKYLDAGAGHGFRKAHMQTRSLSMFLDDFKLQPESTA